MNRLLKTTLAGMLTLVCAFGFASTQAQAQGTILQVQGKLRAEDTKDTVRKGSHAMVFEMRLQPMFLYKIDLESKDFDTYIRVEDANGKQITFNDDVDYAKGNLNSQVSFLPSNLTNTYNVETYRIVVTTYGAGKTGAFSLRVNETPTY